MIEQTATRALLQNGLPSLFDVVAFGNIRWDSDLQRPQQLLARFAKRGHRVFFVEDPRFDSQTGPKGPYLEVQTREPGIRLVIPHLSVGCRDDLSREMQRRMLDQLFKEQAIERFVLWYYNPVALPISNHLQPMSTVYDCLDELSVFKDSRPTLLENEARLLEHSDVVFTGGYSLYEFKKDKHTNIHPIPLSIDLAHFARARTLELREPEDQRLLPHPRIGFSGVIDERFDLKLVDQVAAGRPDWQLIIIGPTAKVDPAMLPRRANIHYLGSKPYEDLPAYLSGWDLAMLPFALNDSTRFISPTETSEYLAAGRPVISTAIRDVIRPYAIEGVVHIASCAATWIMTIEDILHSPENRDATWLQRVDQLLSTRSWDHAFEKMLRLVSASFRKSAFSEPLRAMGE